MASGARGGGAEHLAGLLPALAAAGLEVAAAVGRDGPLVAELEHKRVEVVPLALMGSRLDPRPVWALRRAVRALRGDLVHAHGTRAAFWAALGGAAGRPLVYTAHGLALRQPGSLARRRGLEAAERLICARSARVVCVARADLRELSRRRWLRAGQGVQIGNAIDGGRLGRTDRAAARARLGLPAEAVVIGTVARLVPQKDVGAFVDLVARLPGVIGLIAGDGPERASLAARAAAGGGRARLLGSRADVAELLPALDLFVLTSRWEGEPVALLEAMGTGLACLATSTSGAAELIGDRVSGRLVPVGDSEALADAAVELLGDAPERARLGRAAREQVAGRTFADAAIRHLAVYREVIPLPAAPELG